jgi:hypothetical protein
MAAGPPAVIGFDLEWKPSFQKGAPPNKAALVQLAYYCQVSRLLEPAAWSFCETVRVEGKLAHSSRCHACNRPSLQLQDCRGCN